LKEAAGLAAFGEVTAGQVGFRLGPRINAAGRLDDASMGLQLLKATDLEKARSLASMLDEANRDRQTIEGRILEEALAQAETLSNDRGLVLYSDSWHPGVIGIVASRVVEKFHRPTIVVGVHDGLGRGSGRSIEAFHLLDGIRACAQHLVKFGGHKHAAGITIEPERLPAFREAFSKVAGEQLTEEDLEPRCHIDAVVEPSLWDESMLASLEVLEPFGNGNPQPVFASRRLSARPRVLKNKQEGRAGHLKLMLEGLPQMDVIGFGMEDKAALTEGPVDLAYQVSMDEWNGQRRISWKLKDAKSSV
jgi:single-stranded-DNA-specific exonuclease